MNPTVLTYVTAVLIAIAWLYCAFVIARAVAGHPFQPSTHPNGRCAACGQDHQEHR